MAITVKQLKKFLDELGPEYDQRAVMLYVSNRYGAQALMGIDARRTDEDVILQDERVVERTEVVTYLELRK